VWFLPWIALIDVIWTTGQNWRAKNSGLLVYGQQALSQESGVGTLYGTELDLNIQIQMGVCDKTPSMIGILILQLVVLCGSKERVLEEGRLILGSSLLLKG
jgi:hypothetical protein